MSRPSSRIIPIVIAATVCAASLRAQRLPPPLPLVQNPASGPRRVAPPDDPAGATLGALLGGMAGVVAGSALAFQAGGCSRTECDFGPIVAGTFVGMPVGAALGAWIGNARRGSAEVDLLATAGASLAGYEITRSSNDGMIWLASLVGQIVIAAVVERATGAGHPPRDSLTVQPDR